MKLTPINGGPEILVKPSATVLGSSDECDIRINQPSIADRHCRLQLIGNRIIVQDLGSGLPTCINGTPIKRDTADIGDVIDIGDLWYRVDASEAGDDKSDRLSMEPDIVVPLRPGPDAAETQKRRKQRKPEDIAFDCLNELQSSGQEQASPSPVDTAEGVVSDLEQLQAAFVPPTAALKRPSLISASPQNQHPQAADQAADRTKGNPPTRQSSRVRRPALHIRFVAEQFAQNWSAWLVILLCATIVGALKIDWGRFGETSDREIFEKYQSFYSQFARLQDEEVKADTGDWTVFRSEVSSFAAPLVKELQKSAPSTRPIRRRLLFIVRDHFPAMLQSPADSDDSRQEFTTAMNEVETMLEGRMPSSMPDANEMSGVTSGDR